MNTNTTKVKLLKRVSQKQLQFGFIIVLLSLMVLYVLTRYYIKAEAEEGLYSSTFRIEQLLKNNQQPVSLKPLYEVTKVKTLKPQILKDTLIYDEKQKEDEIFRELNTYKHINGINYRITTRTLFVDYDDTLLSILLSFAIIISLVYLAQYYYSKSINKKIWTPFFKNLEAIRTFSLQSNQPISLTDSDVLEFSELNHHIKSLTEKVTSDYQNLKQFTEDLSHEVQTPLSIIQVKIENLFDSTEKLDENTLSVLNDIQKNAKQISKLNQGLILLAKIENQQFTKIESIETNSLIESIITNFEDIISIKDLNINYLHSQTLWIQMDKVLADILFSNLIGNAIKYTPEHGDISILATSSSFTISNSGKQAVVNSEKIFQRFYKENQQTQSLGLGLAIVKKICDHYDLRLAYNFKDGMHDFSIKVK